MSNYQDRWSRWHDKPTDGTNPSSNNGWIYTAYSKYLAQNTVNRVKIKQCYDLCLRNYDPLIIDRSPNQSYPPKSKDEIIGLVSLGLLHNKDLENNHYNFCNINNDFDRKLTFKSFINAVKVLYKIRNEHRNYVWQNELVEAYPLAFKLGPEDIYYIKRMSGETPTVLETGIAYLNGFMTYFKGNRSARMMLWLKMEDLKHPLLRYIPKNKWVKDYFSKDHTFVKNLEE